MEKEYEQAEAEEQAGFQASRSTIDHVFTMTQVIEKKTIVNQELYLTLRGLKKDIRQRTTRKIMGSPGKYQYQCRINKSNQKPLQEANYKN